MPFYGHYSEFGWTRGEEPGHLNSFSDFLNNMDWWGLLTFLLRLCAVLLCLTVHEVSHGLVAYRLGDSTAKDKGRLTLNPIKHISVFGLALMVTAGVGWAKAVPVNPNNFKEPKRDMAITALAGPVSNFILALLAGALTSVLYFAVGFEGILASDGIYLLATFLISLVTLNIGLGIFNLIPIPPLDGSKVLFSFLPQRVYWTILRYERYVMIALLGLVWLGVFNGPLNWLIHQGIHVIGVITRCPLFL